MKSMKKYLLVVFAVMAALTSCQKEDVFAPWRDPSKFVVFSDNSYFTVMHYNIFGAQGGWTAARFDDVAAVIRSQKPDFVSLNEVDSMTTRNKYHMARELANRTGLTHYYAVAREPYSLHWNQPGAYGDAILSRYPVREVRKFKLYPDAAQGETDKEDRSVCAIKAVVGEQLVWIVTTHLDHRGNEMSRVKQAKDFQTIINQLDGNVIVCGDMNAQPTSNPMKIMYEYLTPCYSTLEPAPATYPSIMPRPETGQVVQTPTSCIDYIMMKNKNQGITCTSYRIVNSKASDHCAVVATFKYN
jgi:endonuclease/exonuclease/phosphatase family metal-dependent hydrolase